MGLYTMSVGGRKLFVIKSDMKRRLDRMSLWCVGTDGMVFKCCTMAAELCFLIGESIEGGMEGKVRKL
jgi:hypothetical protein